MSAPASRGPRLRELGLRIGRFDAGALNAITDVTGVTVGHVTIWRDETEPAAGRGVARTGVTAVVPAPVETIFSEPVPAGVAVLTVRVSSPARTRSPSGAASRRPST